MQRNRYARKIFLSSARRPPSGSDAAKRVTGTAERATRRNEEKPRRDFLTRSTFVFVSIVANAFVSRLKESETTREISVATLAFRRVTRKRSGGAALATIPFLRVRFLRGSIKTHGVGAIKTKSPRAFSRRRKLAVRPPSTSRKEGSSRVRSNRIRYACRGGGGEGARSQSHENRLHPATAPCIVYSVPTSGWVRRFCSYFSRDTVRLYIK